MKLPADILSGVFGRPNNAMFYELSHRLRSLSSHAQVLETDDYDFDPIEFARFGGCELLPRENPSGHWNAEWIGNQLVMTPESGVLDVRWRGESLTLIRIKAHNDEYRWFIVAESLVLIEQFFVSVCRWNSEGSGALLLYENGGFSSDFELREAISKVQLNQIFLLDTILITIRKSILGFFKNQEKYAQNDLPWKRGVILHGPPGNGKTKLIQALINEAGLPAIYVKSLYHYQSNFEESINEIYKRASEIAPCFVIWEDLDSLITDRLRSAFLNQLDGFSPLNGVMTVATTNHLDKLDVAIKDRPSRFDVKLELPNPCFASRHTFFSRKLGPDFAELASVTDGLSFASLQEIVTSAKVLCSSEQSPEQVIRQFNRGEPKKEKDKDSKKKKKKKR